MYTFNCLICDQSVTVDSRRYRPYNPRKFCSTQCSNDSQKTRKILKCLNCPNNFKQKQGNQKFCSRSCAATYNNTHKTTGTRVSKLEVYLQKELSNLYKFEFKFNSKEEINSELDIYIPSLKLAFELSGIFHYEPIFGQAKLDRIQNNDERKFQACLENNIELCIIDSSSLKYFKEQNAKKYLGIVCSIINNSIATFKSTER